MKKLRVSALALLSFLTIACTKGNISKKPDPSQALPWIAHAGGGYKERTYLNCLECFEENYKKGIRIFEFDLMMSSDDYLAAIHDGQEKDYGLPLPPEKFTLKQYMDSTFGDTKRLPQQELIRIMQEKKDWFLVTDIKDDNLKALRKIAETFSKESIEWQQRVLPQVYQPGEIAEAKKLGFENIIFTLYRFGNRKEDVKAALADNKIWGLTLWADWWDADWDKIAKEAGIKAMVHTLNDKARAEGLKATGVDGIYTDFLP